MHPDSIKFKNIKVGKTYSWEDTMSKEYYIVKIDGLTQDKERFICTCLLTNSKYYVIGTTLYIDDYTQYIIRNI